MKKRFFFINFLLLVLPMSGLLYCCKPENRKLPADYEVATAWADLTMNITKTTPANSPTFSSRCFGYIGLTMYESVVNGFPEYQSVAKQLNGLTSLPFPESGIQYKWLLCLNSAQAEILRSIYVQTSDENKKKIDSLERHFLTAFIQNDSSKISINKSISFGKRVAQIIFEWSKTDGGHRAYLSNFDKLLIFKDKPGGWKPPLYAQSFSHFPLHPHWGTNRTFLANNSNIKDPVFIAYDSLPGSSYYNQFKKVYEQEKNLTQEQKEIAIWWSDDPDETVTPPGHSYYLATLAIKKTQPPIIQCAETYARVGMAVADAFRNCWKWKYQFFSERPNTFIPQYIDPHWHSFWPDPPFPAFPSGHAIQAAAAATVLTDLFGNNFAFTDSLHVGRKRDEIRNVDFKARSFHSFWELAEETANSRFYGGIHTPQDNIEGLEKGKEIANNINKLHWKTKSN
jgi:hypothetical protein